MKSAKQLKLVALTARAADALVAEASCHAGEHFHFALSRKRIAAAKHVAGATLLLSAALTFAR
jgi:hypothetical protein